MDVSPPRFFRLLLGQQRGYFPRHSARRQLVSLTQFEALIDSVAPSTLVEDFSAAVGPVDLDGVEVIRLAQAEMGAGFAAAQITLGGVQEANPNALPDAHANRSTERVSIPGGVVSADLQPVAASWGDVSI